MGFGTMLKDLENMSHMIPTDHNVVLVNSAAKVFPTSFTLLCRYRLTRIVIGRLKLVIGDKQIKGKHKKMVKPNVILKNMMDA